MRTRFFNFLATVLLIVPVGLQAQNLSFEDFDKDDDNLIEEKEFEDVFTDNYVDDWNARDDDDHLDDEDFYTISYSIVDVDGNELIDEEEWAWGYDYYYGDYVDNDFDLFDFDDDDVISYTEYVDVMYGTDYFVSWDVDRDSYLSEDELANAVFENWDINNNGVLNKSEFYAFDAHYLDI